MPIHDWTRVGPGTFHDFHHVWIAEIRNALNSGVLPAEYYAQVEPTEDEINPETSAVVNCSTLPPPITRFSGSADIDVQAFSRRRVAVRHSSGDQLIALVDILSSGIKATNYALRRFLHRAVSAFHQKRHLLLVDLFPPTSRAAKGIHGALWAEIVNDLFESPNDKPLTLASYASGQPLDAYIEPVNVGEKLPDMPLFLAPDSYVPVQLEATYQKAWEGTSQRWKAPPPDPACPQRCACRTRRNSRWQISPIIPWNSRNMNA